VSICFFQRGKFLVCEKSFFPIFLLRLINEYYDIPFVKIVIVSFCKIAVLFFTYSSFVSAGRSNEEKFYSLRENW